MWVQGSREAGFDLDWVLRYQMSVNASTTATEVEIWRRTIRPDFGDLAPEEARVVLRWALSPADRERVQELSGKASEGLLTEEESAEMDSYLTVGSALEFLKAKARLSLRRGNLGP